MVLLLICHETVQRSQRKWVAPPLSCSRTTGRFDAPDSFPGIAFHIMADILERLAEPPHR
jgi:hypothetical protein